MFRNKNRLVISLSTTVMLLSLLLRVGVSIVSAEYVEPEYVDVCGFPIPDYVPNHSLPTETVASPLVDPVQGYINNISDLIELIQTFVRSTGMRLWIAVNILAPGM